MVKEVEDVENVGVEVVPDLKLFERDRELSFNSGGEERSTKDSVVGVNVEAEGFDSGERELFVHSRRGGWLRIRRSEGDEVSGKTAASCQEREGEGGRENEAHLLTPLTEQLRQLER